MSSSAFICDICGQLSARDNLCRISLSPKTELTLIVHSSEVQSVTSTLAYFFPESACRLPQIIHAKWIRLRLTALFNRVSSNLAGPSHDGSSRADSWLRNSWGVSLRNSQKLRSGNFKPSRPYGVLSLRWPRRKQRRFQYSRFKSSKPCVILRCRACCIRATLLTHSTRLLARHTPRNTSRTRRACSCQSGCALVGWTVRANAHAHVAVDPGVVAVRRQTGRVLQPTSHRRGPRPFFRRPNRGCRARRASKPAWGKKIHGNRDQTPTTASS